MQVAVVYLTTGAIASAIFVFSSFWIYHYVDLKYESGDLAEPTSNTEMLRGFHQLHLR